MKIGEFSRLHNVSTDTVRFYENEGLLVPVKDGYNYQFDQQCTDDFSNIIQLKDAGDMYKRQVKATHIRTKITDKIVFSIKMHLLIVKHS